MGDGKSAWADEEMRLERIKHKNDCAKRKESADPVILNECISGLIIRLGNQQLTKPTWEAIEALRKAWFGNNT